MIGAGFRTTVGRNGRRNARTKAPSRAAPAAPRSHVTTRVRKPREVVLKAAGCGRRTVIRRLTGVARDLGRRSLPWLARGVASTGRVTRGAATALEATIRLGTGVRGALTTSRRGDAFVLARIRPRGTELRTGVRTGRGRTTGCGRSETIGAGAEDGTSAAG